MVLRRQLTGDLRIVPAMLLAAMGRSWVDTGWMEAGQGFCGGLGAAAET